MDGNAKIVNNFTSVDLQFLLTRANRKSKTNQVKAHEFHA